jgi:hypothetical protein
MRLIGRLSAVLWLGASMAGCGALGAAALVLAGPASAAVTNPPGNASAFAAPSTATADTAVTFQITCVSLDAAAATLFGTTIGLPERIPMDKTSNDGVFSVTVTLPHDIGAGSYHPDMDCDDGSSATASLQVTAIPGGGGAQTGDGTTSTATNTGLAAGGLALIAVGAVAGGIALRRRNQD